MKEYVKSPLNYTGSKYRLIKKGLLDYFPSDIKTFVDLFGGAGNISINIEAEKIIYNDYIYFLPKLFNTWKEKGLNETIDYIENTILQWGLNGENKKGFEDFRSYYNKTKNIEDLFILTCFSFNYQLRFNNKHEYNSSFGKTASTMNDNIRKNLKEFIKLIKEKDVIFLNKDFRELKTDKLDENDFVYCDPPYFLSNGVYQDGKRGFNGWGEKEEKDLYNLLDKLDGNGVRFAFSNLIESKNNSHDLLKEWCKERGYKINYINMEYKNANYQRKESKDIEVLITNY